jgi:DNA polymerase III subunit epsilon
MREIVLDTETTGIDPFDPTGRHRIVEIGGIELVNHVATGATYHQYINPERGMPLEAFDVHGISEAFLADKPVFARIGKAFRDFVGDARLVIHNARFDMRFINAEFEWMGLAPLPMVQAIDTLDIARKRFPGAQNSLDALCRRFGIDNSAREKHGALLDSELLAEVYLELMGGRQPDFALGVIRGGRSETGPAVAADWTPPPRPRPLDPRITAAESEAHAAFVAELGPEALWNRGA